MSTPTDYANAAQALAVALLGATFDPADGVRLLGELADFEATGPTSSAPIGVAMAIMQGASADLFRRAAVVAVAQASMAYQPWSYDDAASVRASVCALIDAEVLIAADQGEDAVYLALRGLRTAVSQDLTARGASLAHLKGVTTGQPMPALALAQRLYQDATRVEQLIAAANPPHPAFMPVNFQALNA